MSLAQKLDILRTQMEDGFVESLRVALSNSFSVFITINFNRRVLCEGHGEICFHVVFF